MDAIDTRPPGPANAGAFTCAACGGRFAPDPALVALLPLLVPQRCQTCASRPPPMQPPPSLDAILEAPGAGPDGGIFVGASCEPNPGPGAWAAVRVVDGAILHERAATEPWTTAARVGLKAVIDGLKLVSPREAVTLYSSDQTAVMTLKQWAPVWRRNGWHLSGPKRERVKNLDLVREALEAYETRPNARVEWLGRDSRIRWNNYARAVARRRLYEDRGERLRAAG